MLKIIAVKTNKGFYISGADMEWSSEKNLRNKLFDGVVPQSSFDSDWSIIPCYPTKVSHMEKQQNINYRFILKDDSLASDKLPLEIKSEDAGAKDCEGTFIWKEELAMYRSLYQEVSDTP